MPIATINCSLQTNGAVALPGTDSKDDHDILVLRVYGSAGCRRV